MADFLLDVPEPLLPRPLLIAILSRGLVRIMFPGVASFPFCIRFSMRVEVLLFSGNRILVFSGMLCLLGASYFPGELFQLFQQVLVGDAKRLQEVGCPPHLPGLAFLEDCRCSYLCSGLIPSVADRSSLFVKELSFPQTAPN